ncbi:MAG: FliG C-terminal domain-containing protein [Hyphomicrobiales bacterium]|nr:FliG C-terminal domain-containing protein [Hyphomicrobiales bacterium]
MNGVQPRLQDSSSPALKGLDKVAAIFLALGKPAADKLLRHFDQEEITEIARSASKLGVIPKVVMDGLITEFIESLVTDGDLQGTAVEVERLLSGIMSADEVAQIMFEIRGQSAQTVWPNLSQIADPALAQYLTKEHPQVAAFILSKASPACAAGVLEILPRDFRNELMRRMLSVKPVTDAAVNLLESSITTDLLLKMARKSGPDIHARVADIINKMKREHMDDVFNSLSITRPKEAEKVKDLLFTFDDIIKLTPAGRAKLLNEVPADRLIIALKGADAGLTQNIIAAVGARSGRMIEQELQSGVETPLREVLKARRAIADLALDMADRGLIELKPDEE